MNEFDVLLTREEIAFIYDIAEKRQKNKEQGGIEDKKYDSNYSSFDMNLYGAAGEFAFCKWEGSKFDDEIHNKRGGWDTIDHLGRRVDVKHSRTDYLLAPNHKKLGACDIYVLVKGDFPMFRIVGWCEEEELLCEENLKDLFKKGKLGYCLYVDNLRRMWSNV